MAKKEMECCETSLQISDCENEAKVGEGNWVRLME